MGGALTDAVFANLAQFARVSICGMISQYNLEKTEVGPRSSYMALLVHQASVQGFLVPQFGAQSPQGIQQMALSLGSIYGSTVSNNPISYPRPYSVAGKRLTVIDLRRRRAWFHR